MTITQFADFYVNVLEPMAKFLFFIVIAVFLLYLLNLVRDAKAKGSLISGMVNLIIGFITKTVTYAGKLVMWVFKMLLKTITVIFASMRDFFTSKI